MTAHPATTPINAAAGTGVDTRELGLGELDDVGRQGRPLEPVDVTAPLVGGRLVDVHLLGHG